MRRIRDASRGARRVSAEAVAAVGWSQVGRVWGCCDSRQTPEPHAIGWRGHASRHVDISVNGIRRLERVTARRNCHRGARMANCAGSERQDRQQRAKIRLGRASTPVMIF
jgi:hypothetical protein